MRKRVDGNELFEVLKSPKHRYNSIELAHLFAHADRDRVTRLADKLAEYIRINLPATFERREGLSDYRTNPYVLMTSASVMNLNDPGRFADFLFNSKLYMALETSFGKSIESILVGQYPLHQSIKWIDAPEKLAEFARLGGLSRQEKARARTVSLWREVDKSCVCGRKRYIVGIKSGPNTINDTQVQAMTDALRSNHRGWMDQTRATYPQVRELDIVIGLTYGTDRTTNNKDNQILAKLLDYGFAEENRRTKPGVLIDQETRTIRIYRRIGIDFWAFIGNPESQESSQHVFLEVLLSLAKGLSIVVATGPLEDRVNIKVRQLALALSKLQFPRNSLPPWVKESFKEDQLFWFATAMTAFFDEGI